jgi:hypothetical protein
MEMGSAEALISGDDAVEHLQHAHALLKDPTRRAMTALVLGRSLAMSQSDQADRVFTPAPDELGGAEPELERLLEVGLIVNALPEPHLQRRLAERHRAPVTGGRRQRWLRSLSTSKCDLVAARRSEGAGRLSSGVESP